MLGQQHRLGRAPRRDAAAAAAATVAASAASGRSVASARCSARSSPSSTAPASARWSSRRSRRAARCSRAAAASSGCAARTRSRVDEQQPGVERVVERVAAGERRELGRAQVAAQRDREQQRARRRGQPATRVPSSSSTASGHRHVLADRRDAALDQRAADLEGEQRVPERRVDDRAQHAARQAQAEPAGQQRRVASRSSGPTSSRSSVPRCERPLERRRRPGRRARSKPDRRVAEPPRREGERLGRRRVEPLHVVDRDQHAAPSAASARSASSRPSAIACGSGGAPAGAARSSATSSAARCGAGRPASAAVPTPSSRSISAAERELRLGAARACRQHRPAVLARHGDPGLPQRRLADPRPARQQQRRPAARQERGQPRELRTTPDDLAAGHGSVAHEGTLSDAGRRVRSPGKAGTRGAMSLLTGVHELDGGAAPSRWPAAGSPTASCARPPRRWPRSSSGAERVAVWAESTLEACVASVAALCAGIPLVPVNPKLGRSELEHVLSDSRPDAIVGAPDGALPELEHAPRRLAVDLDARGGELPEHRRRRRGPRAVIYTSGTTGRAEGRRRCRAAPSPPTSTRSPTRGRGPATTCSRTACPCSTSTGSCSACSARCAAAASCATSAASSRRRPPAALRDGATMLFGVPTMYHRLGRAAAEDPAIADGLRARAPARVGLGAAPRARVHRASRS